MAYINIPENLPGIRGLMAFRPETAQHINELAEILLRDENSLSRGERELIATYVSYLNDCFFCQNAHGAIAQHYLNCDIETLDKIKEDIESGPVSEKMKALLSIAGSVQKSGKAVTPQQVDRAKANGATDKEIHDTVLIAAFFSLCNRYVDGLGTSAPADRQFYVNRGKMRAEEGYRSFDLYK
ncbi:MAG TPA: peroxidase-related enzyme [Cyclobacteriaceae bacterium]|nr:peroxidase-related enzyme [Cyclobacteriaceae bacterium]HRJ83122.1 peroxidase-related enzyme [Cyclobacteriaceae bacterium]